MLVADNTYFTVIGELCLKSSFCLFAEKEDEGKCVERANVLNHCCRAALSSYV